MSAIEFDEAHFLSAEAALLRAMNTPRMAATELAARIAARHGLQAAWILGKQRTPHIMRARVELYRALREPPFSWSYPAIGRFVGGRDHTTIIAALASPERKKALSLRKKMASCRLPALRS
jgi:chromosomal replication initiation ATPase DnaA